MYLWCPIKKNVFSSKYTFLFSLIGKYVLEAEQAISYKAKEIEEQYRKFFALARV